MERLLRDGGDLDSMDRSLLDYNPSSSPSIPANCAATANGKAAMNNGSIAATSPTLPPPPQAQLPSLNGDGGGGGDQAAMAPPPYDEDGGGGCVHATPSAPPGQVAKKDLVVRFDGEKTEVKSVAGGGGGGVSAAAPVAAAAASALAPAQPLSPNDNPAYGSPLRVAEVPGTGGNGGDVRGEVRRTVPELTVDGRRTGGAGLSRASRKKMSAFLFSSYSAH